MNTNHAKPNPKTNRERSDNGLKAAILTIRLVSEHAKLTREQKMDILGAAINVIRLHGALGVVDTLLPDPQEVVRQGGGCEHEVAILELGAEIERMYNAAITRLSNLSDLLCQ